MANKKTGKNAIIHDCDVPTCIYLHQERAKKKWKKSIGDAQLAKQSITIVAIAAPINLNTLHTDSMNCTRQRRLCHTFTQPTRHLVLSFSLIMGILSFLVKQS